MSVRDKRKFVVITDCLTGEIIANISCDLFSNKTICSMIENIVETYVFTDDHGVLIKNSYGI